MGRAAVLLGDLASAEEALRGLQPKAVPTTPPILLAAGMLAYFTGDLDGAETCLERGARLALGPGAPGRMLDVITLQGMIAHNRGEWFDRLRRELRATSENPDLASTVFDSHLCVAEYLLYGPTPYDEVVALAHDFDGTPNAAEPGERWRSPSPSRARRRSSPATSTPLGASSPSGRAAPESGADTGVAHSLQRLAEVELADGDRAEADRLARRALPLARWSPLARHLLQRVYGTLITAAPDAAPPWRWYRGDGRRWTGRRPARCAR